MKSISVLTIIVLLVNPSWGQSKTSFGINANLALPVGKTSDKYGLGYGVGGLVKIPTSSPTVSILAGADYLNLPGKTTTETETISLPGYYSSTTTTTTYADLQLISIFAGPKIGKEDGPYFLPAVAANYAEEFRLGVYLGGGVLFPLKSVKLHLGLRYGVLNIIGQDDDEELESGISISAGLVF